MALGTAVLVKNGIGMAGAVICIALCVIPLVQTAGTALLYKLAAAMIQPVSDERVTGCVEAVGEGMSDTDADCIYCGSVISADDRNRGGGDECMTKRSGTDGVYL